VLEVQFCADPAVRGVLLLDTARMRALTTLAPKSITITGRSHFKRQASEAIIENAYARAYGSSVSCSYPTLMSVAGADNEVLATVGFRPAVVEPLFLEQYLQRPIERVLGDKTGVRVTRDEIVEIGSLASSGKGASIFLFVALAAYLKQQGFTYAVVTATDALRKTFEFFGFDAVELADANPAAIPDGAAWGAYYAHRPKVLAGTIAAGVARVEKFLPPEHNRSLDKLFAALRNPHESATV
jgi:thermostable hemolysin